jgi:threonine/homoserine/homoserine lactone efflux protein
MAIRKWLGRPRGDTEGTLPGWMAALGAFGVGRSLGLGLGLAAANPKNLMLTFAAAAAVAEEGLSLAAEAAVLLGFVIVSTVGVAAPLLVLLAMGDRAESRLEGWNRWLTRHNAALMAAVLMVIGLVLIALSLKG